MRLASGTCALKTSRRNMTIYICYGTRDGVTAQQRANMKSMGALWLAPGDDPYKFTWPVRGAGVILLDYAPMGETMAQVLGLAVKRDGAENLIWANMATGITTYIIGDNHGRNSISG